MIVSPWPLPVTFSNATTVSEPSPVAAPELRLTFTPEPAFAKLTVSVPPPPASVSFPAPPAILSLPSPPSIELALASPVRWSLPEPPVRFSNVESVSEPAPPDAVPADRFALTPPLVPENVTVSVPLPPVSASSPAPPFTVSLPSPPVITLLLLLPVSVSSPEPPVRFSTVESVSVPAEVVFCAPVVLRLTVVALVDDA